MSFYSIPTMQRPMEDWAYWEDALSAKQIAMVKKMAFRGKGTGFVAQDTEDESIRSTKLHWMELTEDTTPIYSAIGHVAASLNAQFFGLDLTGFSERIQLCNYKAKEKGHYDWHNDISNGAVRKLSLTMQLTDPSKYEGGDLILSPSGHDIVVPKKAGYIAVFPSWTPHKVTPVTKGSRQSLVAWFTGPALR